jgi:hypothetical protein
VDYGPHSAACFYPSVSRACIDDNHYTSLVAWGTTTEDGAPSPLDNTDLPPSPVPIHPFDHTQDTVSPTFETTVLCPLPDDIPVTIVGMNLTRPTSSSTPSTGKSMADSGANVCHQAIKMTPYQRWFGHRPDLCQLRIFGSRICVKRTGHRRAKLDKHDFTGIFIGYTATDSNVCYIDLHSGQVKTSHHAVFDECWFHQEWRPPAAQLLYDLGVKLSGSKPAPPMPSVQEPSDDALVQPVLPPITTTPMPPHQHTPAPVLIDDDASVISDDTPSFLDVPIPFPTAYSIHTIANPDATAVDHYRITNRDIAQVYFSSHCFGNSADESFAYHGSATLLHPTAGLVLTMDNGRVLITSIENGTPCAKIPRWKSRLRNSWITHIEDTPVETIDDVKRILATLPDTTRGTCRFTVATPDIRDGLSNEGIPQLTLDQLNPRHFFHLQPDNVDHLSTNQVCKSWDGGVLQYVPRASKLTRGLLLKQHDWDEWQQAEFLQLDQYELQNMFGDPTVITDLSAVFNLVWTYAVKELDQRKKARCTCDGSTRGGQVRVLDFTYANSPDHTCSRVFYALSSAENLLIFGADVSNAFAEAPPPKQGFYIRPDNAFREWWTVHKGRPPLAPNAVIPILSAMQGHPEAPRLWEKHADKILRSIGLQPTTHEPCLYSGLINNSRALLLRQVDDFSVASATPAIANHAFDLINECLTIPLKRLGLVMLFNGLNVEQTRSYIKISCESYILRICEKYNDTWMRTHNLPNRATPLPQHDTFTKSFLSAVAIPLLPPRTNSAIGWVSNIVMRLESSSMLSLHAVLTYPTPSLSVHSLRWRPTKSTTTQYATFSNISTQPKPMESISGAKHSIHTCLIRPIHPFVARLTTS